MEIIIGIFIFCLVLFIYLHIFFHLKTSEDLEIYGLDENISKERFEEICDVRQPVLFNFDSEKIIETMNKDYLMKNYPAFEIKIRNIKEKNNEGEVFVPLSIGNAFKLFDSDKEESYYSESNSDFLQETCAIKNMQYNDEFLRPFMLSNSNYDIMFGSKGVITPFRYELNYRNFFLVNEGSIQIKLTPPKSAKYLSPINDYEIFEFRSPMNPWNIQAQYSADFNKIKCLEFNIPKGKTIFIPAYWWYSIKFNENSSISCFRYRTYMNNLAITPNILIYALQQQNIKREVVKKANVEEISENTHQSHDDQKQSNIKSQQAHDFIQNEDKIEGTPISELSESKTI